MDESLEQSEHLTYFVDTDCFYAADKTSKAKAEAQGVDIDRHNNSVMALIEVLKPEG